jgi:hypothetical protein
LNTLTPLDHAEIMNRCSDKADKLGLSALSKTERVVHLVNVFNFEVLNGTLSQFFYNSAGDHAVETVPALEAVRAKRAAAALRGANHLFPRGAPPADRMKRYDAWRKLIDTRRLEAFDDEIGQEKPDVWCKLCTFIDAHAAELQQHSGA